MHKPPILCMDSCCGPHPGPFLVLPRGGVKRVRRLLLRALYWPGRRALQPPRWLAASLSKQALAADMAMTQAIPAIRQHPHLPSSSHIYHRHPEPMAYFASLCPLTFLYSSTTWSLVASSSSRRRKLPASLGTLLPLNEVPLSFAG